MYPLWTLTFYCYCHMVCFLHFWLPWQRSERSDWCKRSKIGFGQFCLHAWVAVSGGPTSLLVYKSTWEWCLRRIMAIYTTLYLFPHVHSHRVNRSETNTDYYTTSIKATKYSRPGLDRAQKAMHFRVRLCAIKSDRWTMEGEVGHGLEAPRIESVFVEGRRQAIRESVTTQGLEGGGTLTKTISFTKVHFYQVGQYNVSTVQTKCRSPHWLQNFLSLLYLES